MVAMVGNKPMPPTLSEQFGEESPPVEAPVWLQSVACPRCFRPMTPLRSKANQWGESVVYQCHNEISGKLCLIVITLTTTVRNYMRPGDFSDSQFDWKVIAPQTIPASKIKPTKQDKFAGVPRVPPCPWKKTVVAKVIWDAFWDNYKKGITPDELIKKAAYIKGDSVRLRELVSTLPKWIAEHTGYSVIVRDGVYQIIGKTKGNLKLFPYSDDSYRKVHGV